MVALLSVPSACGLKPERSPVAQALNERCGMRDGKSQGALAECEGSFFRRRHLQHPEGSYYYIELRPLNLKWSFTSRVTTDYETLKSMKAAYSLLAMSQVTRKFQKQ